MPLLVPLERGVAKPLGERTVGEHPHQRSGEPVDVARIDEERSRSSRATSGIPPTRLATIPRPRAIDSTRTPQPFRTRRQHEHRRTIHLGGDALRQELLDVLDLLRQLRHQLLDDVSTTALAEDHEERLG